MNALVREEFLAVYTQKIIRHPTVAVTLNSAKNEKCCIALCGRIARRCRWGMMAENIA